MKIKGICLLTMDILFNLLESINPLSEGLRTYLNMNVESKPVKRKEFLLRKTQVSSNIYFIESGLFRCFYEIDNKTISSWFMFESDMIVSVNSFFRQIPSYENIQALEDSLVHFISYDKLQYIYKEYPEFNIHGRRLTEMYYMKCDERLFAMRTKTTAERFEFLVKHHSDYLLRIPSKYLATYLGMQESTFSRAKKKVNLAK